MRRHPGVQLGALTRRAWLVTLLAALTFGITARNAAAQNGRRTTVILVRHAEKAAEPAADPPLTEAGKARAEALWLAVKDAGVQVAITTQLARTIQTAAPTVAQLGIRSEVVSANGADHPARVASAIKGHAGETVLVVGHSNTVPAIIAALGAKQPDAICDEVYDNFYVVTIHESGKASVIHSRYGVATPAGPSCGAMK
ncbi:MAG TPA: phosphoglycerate mutase family protein [Gemmatimonadaceae bacterium]|jgi:broad specificity phosphatase PhoE